MHYYLAATLVVLGHHARAARHLHTLAAVNAWQQSSSGHIVLVIAAVAALILGGMWGGRLRRARQGSR